MQHVVARRHLPLRDLPRRLHLGRRIRMAAVPVVRSAALLLIAVIVIAEHRVNRQVSRPEMLRDLRPLRIVDTRHAARIEVIADEQDAVDRLLLYHREHPFAKLRMRGAGIAGDDESQRLMMRKLKGRSRKERGKKKESLHASHIDRSKLNER